ncbi:alcohol dehydrogenase catalytic domain-containing protein [Oceanicola sp. 502str15]|uniref:alcohol dehydrogenase catalytic domain-containing protein n=1 Tax=Oceanicola sp. 502str15 TaxID=2696061 RepID=UPI0020960CDE|nr:alcohol dehydrogenase catalytic domain-containing protein [Oceanicola sp. 502str15]MCO6384392.1 FAD-dependent oxidoreductase [Oceanicola sp. 502str15]
MKALVYHGTTRIEWEDVPPPPVPGAGRALLEVAACGICGSDMHGYHGHDPRRVPPMIMGHEAAGVVRGGALDGQRVALNPFLDCGHCAACLAGAPQLCEAQANIGLPPNAGAFAGLVAAPERNLVPIPDDMPFTTAALAEPVAVSVHAVAIGMRALGRPLSTARLVVLGGGAIGLTTALVLIAEGAGEVVLIETNPARRATAAAASARLRAVAPEEAPPAGSADMIFDAVGAAATRAQAFALARRGGVIVHSGLLPGSDGTDVRALTLRELSFLGAYCYSMADFRQALALLQARALGALDWVEQRPMSEGSRAFADIDAGRVAAAKVILTT